MTLLESLTSKPRWQHRRPEVRLEAVEELQDPEILLQIVREDDDLEVRSAALTRIEDGEALEALATDSPGAFPDSLRVQARRQRLRQLLPDGERLNGIDDPGVLARIAVLAEEPGLVEQAIDRIGDETVRMDLALQHPVARARLRAAEGLTDPEALQALMQQARHRDKAVFRHCRERLDRMHAVERREREQREALDRIASDAADLRQSPETADFPLRYRGLVERWSQLAGTAEAAVAERVAADLDVCARRIEQREAARQAEADEAAEVAAAERRFAELLRRMEAIGAPQDDASPAGQLRELDKLEEQWVLAQQLAQPDEADATAFRAGLGKLRAHFRALQAVNGKAGEFERLADAAESADQSDYRGLQGWLDKAERLEQRIGWPVEAQPVPAALAGLREGRASVERRMAQLVERQDKTIEKVEQALQSFTSELATNHYRNADRALDRLRNLMRQLPPKNQARYQRELKPLLVRLKEIHDWQGFAIEPKKQELIGQMRALAVSAADPDGLAARIHALQEQWKQLGSLGPARDRALWKDFKAASDEAWKPCKKAFAERARQRRETFRARMGVVEQLVEYERQIAWPDLSEPEPGRVPPDWKRVRQTLRAAREAFRELSPVDRKQERSSQKALDAVCDRIHGHLKAEYDRNIEAKKSLVEEARALADEPDLKRAIDRAKAIQSQWKTVGPVPRPVDQKLWKSLRKACDSVFGRLDERREERQAAARADEERRAQRRVEKLRCWENLLARMRACALRAEEPATADTLWAAADSLPKRIDSSLLDAWWAGEAPAEDEDAWREACIAIEVLAGQPSPPADREARMAYQMQRLVEGMGQQGVDRGEALLEQIERFTSLRPPLPWVERFSASVRTLRGLPGEPAGNDATAPEG